MEMQQIRYFLKLAQTLNFTRAAEECNVTQPALTRAIRALEAELGGDLIRREMRNSHLTELGRRMLPLLQQCHDAAHSAKSLARAVQSNEVAPLALGIMRGINMARFMGPLGELFRAFPGAQLRIRRGSAAEILTLLKDGETEIAITSPDADTWDRLDSWTLFDDPFGLVAHRDHRMAGRNQVTPEDLAGERLLCLAGCEMRAPFEHYLAEHNVVTGSAHEVETDDDLLALLEANAGIAMVAASSPASTALRRFQLPNLTLNRPVAVQAVAGRQRSPVSGALLNLLRAYDWPEPAVA